MAPYRAEVEGIRRLLMAVLMARGQGRLVIISDCQAAILAVEGRGQARLLVQDVQRQWRAVQAAGIEVSIHWVRQSREAGSTRVGPSPGRRGASSCAQRAG